MAPGSTHSRGEMEIEYRNKSHWASQDTPKIALWILAHVQSYQKLPEFVFGMHTWYFKNHSFLKGLKTVVRNTAELFNEV